MYIKNRDGPGNNTVRTLLSTKVKQQQTVLALWNQNQARV